jgi:soluble lytic murein transglycosylase-like protein
VVEARTSTNNNSSSPEPAHERAIAKTTHNAVPAATTQQSAPSEATEPIRAGLGCEAYRPIVSKYDWDVNTALAIMRAESGCRADAYGVNTNGSNDAGLMQINSVHVGSVIGNKERFDAAANIAAAYKVYRGSGWRAWATFTNGSYKKYL